LLKQELGYGGMIFTDALEMKGVTKYFPGGEISREAILAGNDILCLPEDIAGTLGKIKKAIKKRKLTWAQIDKSVLKLLNAKFDQDLQLRPADLNNITADLNRESTIRRTVAEHSITLLKHNDKLSFPLAPGIRNRIAYIGLGINSDNAFAKRMRADYNADVFYFDYKQDSLRLLSLIPLIQDRYDAVIIGVHQVRRFPANNFGISNTAVKLVNNLQGKIHNTVFVFGNPYAIKNFTRAENIIACFEDERITQETAADILNGLKITKGTLPVSVAPDFVLGSGIRNAALIPSTSIIGMDLGYLKVIDSIADDAIKVPGMVVLVADGKIAYTKPLVITLTQ
jgi:beta-glucosidase-like glycosyl hydrolase